QDLCAFCVKGSCDSQQSGLTCRHFIKTFLLGKIKTYEHHLKKSLEEHAGQYAFLDCLRASRDNTAPVRDKLAAAFPQMNDYQLAAILSVWEDTLAV
ncbi:MAG: hypothetical protein LBL15_02460, partial [Oscillospiraceae bacterium]|nr:hypothetical protein [Oscillospiraceae bacterium]